MELFWKSTGCVLICVVLTLALGKQEKDISAVLSLTACIMVIAIAMAYIQPVFDFILKMEETALPENGMLSLIIKSVGIVLVTELTGTICSDAGNRALGKAMHFLGTAAVLSVSLPAFQAFLELIRETLNSI